MKQILGAFRRTSFGTVAALFLLTVVGVALPARQATAGALQYRSLQLSSSAPGDQSIIDAEGNQYAPGTGGNGQKVSHTYIFQANTTGTAIKALTFEYCTDPFAYVGATECAAPSGFSASAAPSASVSLSNGGSLAAGLTWGSATTFAVSGTATNSSLTVANATGVTPGSGINAGQFVRVVFTATSSNFFKNPNAAYANGVASPNQSQTFFAHVVTYSSDTTIDGTTDVDEGTVTSSVANTVSINTRVQETLKFSVGGSGGSADIPSSAANDPGASCTALDTNGALTMGDSNQALSPATASTAKSYARVTTNASRGTKIMYAGQSLISTAGDKIDPIGATAAASTPGTAEQFGLAVRASNAGAFEGYSALAPATAYDYVGNGSKYAFDEGSNTAPVVLASANTIINCETLPIEYVANITNQTPAGLYTTRVSYIAVPSY